MTIDPFLMTSFQIHFRFRCSKSNFSFFCLVIFFCVFLYKRTTTVCFILRERLQSAANVYHPAERRLFIQFPVWLATSSCCSNRQLTDFFFLSTGERNRNRHRVWTKPVGKTKQGERIGKEEQNQEGSRLGRFRMIFSQSATVHALCVTSPSF